MNARDKTEKEQALAQLRELCPPGTTVHCILRHVSRSGMHRRISLAVVDKSDGSFFQIDWLVVRAGIAKHRGRDEGLAIGGCGMDMGFALVSDLSHYLYPNGFGCIGKGCPSNDHANGDRDYTPHDAALVAEIIANGVKPEIAANHWHRSGSYALRHRWI